MKTTRRSFLFGCLAVPAAAASPVAVPTTLTFTINSLDGRALRMLHGEFVRADLLKALRHARDFRRICAEF